MVSLEGLGFGSEITPLMLSIGLVASGFLIVSLAKLYGFFFMRGPRHHRVGSSMSNVKAEVTEWAGGEGYVLADGELWRARSKQALSAGDQVRISQMDGLVVTVKRKP